MAFTPKTSGISTGGRALTAGLLAMGLSLLAGCNSSILGGGAEPPAPIAAPSLPTVNGPTVGQTFGTGAVRVGLILPLTQNGQPFAVGGSLANAAQLAVQEAGGTDITVMLLDDKGSADGAAQAASDEYGAGAQIVFGPLFADAARQAGATAQSAGRPLVAFSTDVSVARPGVYLLSFLNEGYVDRIMDFAVSRGKKSIGALIPQGAYGNVVAAAFNQAAARLGVNVVAVQRYTPGQAAQAAQQLAAQPSRMDALFAPEQADAMAAVADALAAANVHVQLLGTGVWNDPRLLASANMQGAWFAAPENAGFQSFAKRYQAQFHSAPTRLATLAYDAVSLATGLARKYGAAPYNAQNLTDPSGFIGADGVFRFHQDGTNERGLAVLQVGAGGTTSVLSPAQRSFAGG